jgi:hypothetical protein
MTECCSVHRGVTHPWIWNQRLALWKELDEGIYDFLVNESIHQANSNHDRFRVLVKGSFVVGAFRYKTMRRNLLRLGYRHERSRRNGYSPNTRKNVDNLKAPDSFQ